MSATYSFLPWLRQGLANQITRPTTPRCSVRATVARRADAARRQARRRRRTTRRSRATSQLYGPGDIVGIERARHRPTEPRDWITNFEPNYLAVIEFYDEDFPWRYTPARADARRTACARGSRWSCSRRTSSTTGRTCRTGRCRSSTSTDAANAAAAGRAVGLGARARQPQTLVERRRVRVDRHGRGRSAARAASSTRTPTSPTRGSCARAGSSRTRPTTRSSCRRSRAGGSPGLGLDPPRRGRTRHARRGRDAARGRQTLPVLPPLVLPHRRDRRLRVPGAAARAAGRSTAASACATWTCRTRARTSPASGSDAPTARRHPEARRRAAGPRRLVHAGRARDVEQYRKWTTNWDHAVSAPVPAATSPRSSTWPTTIRAECRGAQRAASRGQAPTTPRPSTTSARTRTR